VPNQAPLPSQPRAYALVLLLLLLLRLLLVMTPP
jgi:hypothetical protein